MTFRRMTAAMAALIVCGAGSAQAADWQWTVTPYVWTTDIGAKVSIDSRQVIDTGIPFSDLLKDLEMVAQVRVEAQHGALGMMTDFFGARLAKAGTRAPLPGGAGEAVLDSTIDMVILDAAGTFNPSRHQRGFTLLYGTRVIVQRAEIDALIEPAAASMHQASTETLVDGLIGAQFAQRLSRRWSYLVRGDVSTGSTEYTWSASASASYAFGKGGRYALTAGYRYMSVRFDTGDPLTADMTLSGLTSGFRIGF